MLKYKTLMLSTALAFGLTTPGLTQETSADTVVATVNETNLTVGHLIALMSTLTEREQQLGDDVLFEGLLERLIQQTAVSASQSELSFATKLRLENERSALNASDVVEKMAAAIEVTDDKVQEAYDLRFADFTPAKEYNASHILVETEDEAKAIVAELEGGADFAELAKTKSTGPSGPDGGNLDWSWPGRLVPEFEAAANELEIGQVSGPVKTQFGWHIIKLNDTRIPEAPTLDEVRAELQQELWRSELQAGIDALIESSEVVRPDVSDIDPAVLRDLSLIDK